jgi:hypothetical protein
MILTDINHITGIHVLVPAPIASFIVAREEPLVVFFTDNDKTQTRPPLLIGAILPRHDRGHPRNLHIVNLRKLAFGDAVSIENDPFRVNLVLLLEPFEEFLSAT